MKYETALAWLVPQTVEQVKAETQKKLEEDKKQLTNLKYENTDLKGKMNSLSTRQETTESELSSIFFLTNFSAIKKS